MKEKEKNTPKAAPENDEKLEINKSLFQVNNDLRKQREAELEALRGPKSEISFGNQIRNYVLYPFQLVKDTRTGLETSNVDSVLQDGDLDPFVIAYHRWAVGRKDAS